MSEVRPGWKMSEEQLAAFMDSHSLKDYHWARLVDSERSAQNLQDLRGKIIRINRNGTIPQDNPRLKIKVPHIPLPFYKMCKILQGARISGSGLRHELFSGMSVDTASVCLDSDQQDGMKERLFSCHTRL